MQLRRNSKDASASFSPHEADQTKLNFRGTLAQVAQQKQAEDQVTLERYNLQEDMALLSTSLPPDSALPGMGDFFQLPKPKDSNIHVFMENPLMERDASTSESSAQPPVSPIHKLKAQGSSFKSRLKKIGSSNDSLSPPTSLPPIMARQVSKLSADSQRPLRTEEDSDFGKQIKRRVSGASKSLIRSLSFKSPGKKDSE
jgi:hypothetical protein